MRKPNALFLCSLAFFLVSASAFAQYGTTPATISMWNRGVFNLYESATGTTSVGPDWMGYIPPQGAYNGLTVSYAAGSVSWVMTAEWEGDWTKVDISKTVLSEFSGSYAMFGGAVRLSAGKVRSDGGYRFTNFDTAGFSTRIADGETGILLNVLPARGLSIGTFLPVPVASQSAATTYQHMNFGASWEIPKLATFKTSFRLEPYSIYGTLFRGKEFAFGGQLTAVPNLIATLGYRWFIDVNEHDFFTNASYRFHTTNLGAYAYMSLQGSNLYKGFKVNPEQLLGKSPLVAGLSVAWGEDPNLWWLNGWDINPYIRYDFGGSSVQFGVDGTYVTSFAYRVQLAYTIGF